MARRVRPLFDVWRSALARIQVLSSVATSHRNTLIDDRLKREGFARMLLAYGVAIRQRRRRLTDGMRALVRGISPFSLPASLLDVYSSASLRILTYHSSPLFLFLFFCYLCGYRLITCLLVGHTVILFTEARLGPCFVALVMSLVDSSIMLS